MTNGNDLTTPIQLGGKTYDGLTKREYFAAAALQGFSTNCKSIMFECDASKVADSAVEYADELIKALNKSEAKTND